MAIISAQNLYKTYRIVQQAPGLVGSILSVFKRTYILKEAVKDVSFDIERGEIVGYIGSNGAGKSTTLKMLSGILTPTSGRAVVAGRIPYEQRKENARHIGVVFGQRSQLYWDLPVSDSFELSRKLYDIDEGVYRQNRECFVELLGMADFIDQPARQLSLGQKMKANLALAMLHDPDILFLDEPTIGLDVTTKKALRRCIRMLNHEKKTTIMLTTHDMDDIEAVCSRIILIDSGMLLFDGSLQNFRGQYKKGFVINMQFIDTPPQWQGSPDFVLLDHNANAWTVQAAKTLSSQEALTRLIHLYNPTNILIREEDIEQIVSRVLSRPAS